MGSESGKRASDEGKGAFRDSAIDSLVDFAKRLHAFSDQVDGPGGSSSTQRRAGALAFELAHIGLNAWRELAAVQRRFEPALLGKLLSPRGASPAADDLHVREALVRTSLPALELTLTLENRAEYPLDIVLPRTLELHRSDGLDKVIVEVHADPCAPLLGAGDLLTLKARLEDVGDLRSGLADCERRYDGRFPVRVRGGTAIEIPIIVTADRASE